MKDGAAHMSVGSGGTGVVGGDGVDDVDVVGGDGPDATRTTVGAA